MKLDTSQLQSRLEATPLKQLFYLNEMAQFQYHDLRMSKIESPFIRYPWFPDAEPGSIHAAYIWEPTARWRLSHTIDDHLKHRYLEIHKKINSWELLNYAPREGYYPFVALWDHWQSTLQKIVCGVGPSHPKLGTSPERSEWGEILQEPHLWYEGENEEG